MLKILLQRLKTKNILSRIIKGTPKLKISWQFMNNSGSKLVPIAGSDNVLCIPDVEDKDAGRYKCVVENIAGSDEHVTTLIIECMRTLRSQY